MANLIRTKINCTELIQANGIEQAHNLKQEIQNFKNDI